ncbi:hypothetical protein AwDysgo_21470 [Bacteroidales bacterium]|nr:hypothetical protein AwDysgo_21470 [Bacteroidales bacterium]
MADWKKIIAETNSIAPKKVEFLFFFNPKNERELTSMLKMDKFELPVFYDKKNEINQLNSFPDDMMFQAFLLDKDNKVIIVGNPSMNPQIWDLYKQEIMGIKIPANIVQTTVSVEESSIMISDMQLNKTSEAVFVLHNTGDQALVINDVKASCGCTVPLWDKHPISPNERTEIVVNIKPDNSGHFHKSIDVYCNARTSPLKLSIKGEVNK